ncbi:MAG: hypothetical protein M1826_006259 [Phylliscum demangeonii]|nr:MAG: hypothetical protein M1826_006259 [Phylliscum demangeonii]
MSRSQRSSLKDLVDRFNQTSDESLPVPSGLGRRADAPVTRAYSPGLPSSRIASTSTSTSTSSARLGLCADVTQSSAKDTDRDHLNARRPPSSRQANSPAKQPSSPPPLRPARPERSNLPGPANSAWAVPVMVAHPPAPNHPVRQPLFGEIVDPSAHVDHVGFGIAALSEPVLDPHGRPALAHRRAKSQIDDLPSSPSDWYRAVATAPPHASKPSPDASSATRPPHRRVKSDYTAHPSIIIPPEAPPRILPFTLLAPVRTESGPPPHDTSPTSPQSSGSLRSPQSPQSPQSLQSRIPVSTRRRSTPSDGGAPAPTGRAASHAGAMHGDTPSLPRSRDPMPKRGSRSALLASHRPVTPAAPRYNRHDIKDLPRPGISPSLKAYISAPASNKSPPLRSSRPRMPVSAASTSASRAKMVARSGAPPPMPVPARMTRAAPNEPKPKSKTIPELGAVDFAARREKIQRAINRGVKERGLEKDRRVPKREDAVKSRATVVSTPDQDATDPAPSVEDVRRPPPTSELAVNEMQPTSELTVNEMPPTTEPETIDPTLHDHVEHHLSPSPEDDLPQLTTSPIEPSTDIELDDPQDFLAADSVADRQDESKGHSGEPETTFKMTGIPSIMAETSSNHEGETPVDEFHTDPALPLEYHIFASLHTEMGAADRLSPRPYTRPVIDDDRADQESIQIMLQPSPLVGGTPDLESMMPQPTSVVAGLEDDTVVILPQATFVRETDEGTRQSNGRNEELQELKWRPQSLSQTTPLRETDEGTRQQDPRNEERQELEWRPQSEPRLSAPLHVIPARRLLPALDTPPPPLRVPATARLSSVPFASALYTHANPADFSAGLLHTPQTGTSTFESSTHSAVNQVYDQCHQREGGPRLHLGSFPERPFSASADLARLGGWDLQPDPTSDAPDFDPTTTAFSSSLDSPADPEPEPLPGDDAEPLEPRRADAYQSSTEFESDASAPLPGDERPSYELSEGGWSSIRQSLETDDERETTYRSSMYSREEWENVVPVTADPALYPAEEPPTTPEPIDSPTLPSRTLYPPLTSQSSGNGSLRSPPPPYSQAMLTAPFSAHERPLLPEIESIAGGLGLSMGLAESELTMISAPPPLPPYSPPPPPASSVPDAKPADEHHTVGDARAPRSPPSPSVHARSPPTAFYARGHADDATPQIGAVRTSDASSQSRVIYTPPPPPTHSSSPHGREPKSADHGSSRMPEEPTAEQRRLTRRRLLIKELVDTEGTYGRDMSIVVQLYRDTSYGCTEMTDDDINVLFGNVQQVTDFSQAFYDVLRRASHSVYAIPNGNVRHADASAEHRVAPDEQSGADGSQPTEDEKDRRTVIGDAFAEWLGRMERVYGEYLRNHDAANQKLQKFQNKPRVSVWLESCRAAAQDITRAWDLDSLLVKPVQRLLKYPLLLAQLLEVTPENHPDFIALDFAIREITAASHRINEMKKRVDLIGKVVYNRKRKESDVRHGLSKAFGRRTERFKQQVGLSETVDDPEFNGVAERWNDNFMRLQFAMRDIQGYLDEVQAFVERFQAFIQAIEAWIDVAHTTFAQQESRWRKFGLAVRELAGVALAEHRSAVEACVVEPMRAIILLYAGPHKVIHKRNKRVVDFARCRAAKERGDRPDKRTEEQSEQFVALNETLKEELPRLYALSGKLADACLSNFVELQLVWQMTWQVKMRCILDENQVFETLPMVVDQFVTDFGFTENQVLTLGICNGAVLGEAINLLSPQSTRTTDELSLKRPSVASGRSRARSANSSSSPGLPSPEAAAFMPSLPAHVAHAHAHAHAVATMPSPGLESPPVRARHHHQYPTPSHRTPPKADGLGAGAGPRSGAIPSASPRSADFPTAVRSMSASAATHTNTRDSMSRIAPHSPRLSIETPGLHAQAHARGHAHTPPTRPFSGFLSSAMPMAMPVVERERDSPRITSPQHLSHPSRPASPLLLDSQGQVCPRALFAVASKVEFTMDRVRMEAGYPYLTYAEGEIFDVVAEKGELWLARNQDDLTRQIGWIWCEHFVKLVDTP